MHLTTLDWSIIALYFAVSLWIGLRKVEKSQSSASEFFLSGRNMPWWLLGVSMVATTFSCDTPNLVTDIVRQNGVSGNWAWWAFLLTGMLTVFVYARLWRRSGVLTDLEFYEMRYSGKEAAFLRMFRALYLGVFFNVMIMATVSLAAIKIGQVMFGISPGKTLAFSAVLTVIYASIGGFRAVLLTDFFQFFVAMIGAIGAAVVVCNLPETGSLPALLNHPDVRGKLSLLPDFSDTKTLIPLLIVPLAVQWWSVWYPGAEPGGGGYVAQRMLAAKDEKNAVGATLLFNIAHYALRPWPWILVGLASLVVFPMKLRTTAGADPIITAPEAEQMLQKAVTAADMELLTTALYKKQNELAAGRTDLAGTASDYRRIDSLMIQNPNSLEIKSLAYIFRVKNGGYKEITADPAAAEKLVYLNLAYPLVSIDRLGHDLGYPAMMRYMPMGLLGIIVAALAAAYMSTISTHLNWGSSYVVNDVYQRFVNPGATEKQMVRVGRLSTVVLMALASVVALGLSSALDTFQILLQIGAGTGLLFILRWFWWRINVWSELSAMVLSFIVALVFHFGKKGGWLVFSESWMELVAGVGITTAGWLAATFATTPTEHATLLRFFQKIRPEKAGWMPVVRRGIADGELTDGSLQPGQFSVQLQCMVAGCFTVYAALFAVGYLLYGNYGPMAISLAIATIGAWYLMRKWDQIV